MQISTKYQAIPAQSTNTDPTIWKLELEATGSYDEIQFYNKFLNTFSRNYGRNMLISDNKEFLIWIYKRLEKYYSENTNTDFMLKFRSIIDETNVDMK